jgi:hypothetical protein
VFALRRNDDHQRFLAAIPLRYRQQIDALPPQQRRRELSRWYWWWVNVGRKLDDADQGQLYGEDLPPWASNPDAELRRLERRFAEDGTREAERVLLTHRGRAGLLPPVSQASLVAEYRRAHPRSRAQGVLRYVVNTGARKQRECILCGWQGPTWSSKWPKTKQAREEEDAHVASHMADPARWFYRGDLGWGRNPDSHTRRLERAWAESGGDEGAELAYLTALIRGGEGGAVERARLRQLRGDQVDPWELNPLSYLFLQACESWEWNGPFVGNDNPMRVEGRRLTFQGEQIVVHYDDKQRSNPVDLVTLAVGVQHERRRASYEMVKGIGWTQTPASHRDPVKLFTNPLALNGEALGPPWVHYRHGAVGSNQNVPYVTGHETRWQIDLPPLLEQGAVLAPHELAPTERFYVAPSSYPMYRGPHDYHTLTDRGYQRNSELWDELGVHVSIPDAPSQAEVAALANAIHLAAVRWYVSQGAVPYRLNSPDPDYWSPTQERVLVCVANKTRAARFAEGRMTDRPHRYAARGNDLYELHNAKILIPRFWETARIMRRVGRRWKNPWGPE